MSCLAGAFKFNLLKFFIDYVDLRLPIVVIVSLEMISILVTIVRYRFIGQLFFNPDLEFGGLRWKIFLYLELFSSVVPDLFLDMQPCVFVSYIDEHVFSIWIDSLMFASLRLNSSSCNLYEFRFLNGQLWRQFFIVIEIAFVNFQHRWFLFVDVYFGWTKDTAHVGFKWHIILYLNGTDAVWAIIERWLSEEASVGLAFFIGTSINFIRGTN